MPLLVTVVPAGTSVFGLVVALNVRRLRMRAGMSRAHVARLAGVRVDIVEWLECDMHLPPIEVLVHVAMALSVPISVLFSAPDVGGWQPRTMAAAPWHSAPAET